MRKGCASCVRPSAIYCGIFLGIDKKALANSIWRLRISKEQLAKSNGEPASSSLSGRSFYRSIDGALR